MSDIREEVKARYGELALSVTDVSGSSCCDSSCCGDQSFGSSLYDTLQQEELPSAAVMASLGCGNPTAVADLRPGEVVLDLGSGGGIDVLLSAKRVSPGGKAYGLDMTDEMLELARQNLERSELDNVEFLKGHIEDIPLPADSVDVVISNCVINLSPDKNSVFAEIHRVLRPGGRVAVSDIVAADELTEEQKMERGSYVGCIAGALSFSEYHSGLTAAGFSNATVDSTHQVADGMYSAVVRATKS